MLHNNNLSINDCFYHKICVSWYFSTPGLLHKYLGRVTNRPKITEAIWAPGIKEFRALIVFFLGPVLFFLISFIHQAMKWANIFKRHFGPWSFLGPSQILSAIDPEGHLFFLFDLIWFDLIWFDSASPYYKYNTKDRYKYTNIYKINYAKHINQGDKPGWPLNP